MILPTSINFDVDNLRIDLMNGTFSTLVQDKNTCLIILMLNLHSRNLRYGDCCIVFNVLLSVLLIISYFFFIVL